MSDLRSTDPADVLNRPEFWEGNRQDQVFRKMRQSSPVSWQSEPATEWEPKGGPGFWSVVTHELVTEVSRNPEIFGSRYGTEIIDQAPEIYQLAGMLNMDAPEHTRLRAIVSRVFTPRRINAMMHDIQQRAQKIIDKMTAMGEFDFVTEVADTFPAGIVAEVMGVAPSDVPALVELTKQILSPPPELAHRANLEMIEYGTDLALKRAAQPTDDLLSLLVKAEVEGQKLSPREIGVFFALLLTAGIETTGTALNHGVVALHQFPDQRAKWLSDYDKLAPAAIEEMFRWASPVRRFRRTALVDTELAGTPITAGDKVVMWYMSANRDETVFDNPHVLDVTRSPNPHLAFGGGGHHFCLGANLARAEATVFLRTFLHAFPHYELTADVDYATNDAFNVVASVPCSTGRTR
ncbi:cytochrome P450 [Streptomyces sp. NPDC048253]|uniref:cytochrome P450 n=1 Tax=Streptomyces sp. NPDC048253 TaxID=3365524 RepID=UPI0037174822